MIFRLIEDSKLPLAPGVSDCGRPSVTVSHVMDWFPIQEAPPLLRPASLQPWNGEWSQ